MTIVWKESYKIGNADIDSQHEQWFENINHFLQAKDKEYLRLCEIQMYRYTRVHFAHEETLMRRTKYPEIREHVAQHNVLLNKLNEIAPQIADGTLDLSEWRTFLSDWLLNHIATIDTKLSKYIEEKEVQVNS
jgi:hemerythrin